MGNFYGNGLMNGSFSRYYKIKLGCRRGSGRLFCNESKNAIIPDSNRNGIDLSNNKPLVCEENTKQSIGLKDFYKGMNFDDSLVSTMERIFTFKIHESGKFIELTKNFLTNPKFLQFTSYQIKKAKSAHDVLGSINDQWYEETALRIKNATYKFKPAKQVSIPKPNIGGPRILTIMNCRDRIIQKAMAILLEMIYEKSGYFHEESHSFRPDKSSHSALHQIKLGWHSIPYYIKVGLNSGFEDINHKVLIDILKEKINDKRFIDLINKMYNVSTLCPETFWIKKKNGIIRGNVLSQILCNIYLDRLDSFVKNEIIAKMTKGKRPLSNPEYLRKIGLTQEEEKLPEHIKNKIRKARRRHVQKLRINRVIENEGFIRIKYIRYANDIIIGVRGSFELAKKIKEQVKDFLKKTLHLELNEKKTKITDTYADRVSFLGMYIYNKKPYDLSYRNSREIENTKRVIRKKKAIKNRATIQILKNTRQQILKILDDPHKNKIVTDALSDIDVKGKDRNKIKALAKAIEDLKELDMPVEPKNKELLAEARKKNKQIPKQVPLNRRETLRRIMSTLTKYNSSVPNKIPSQWPWPIQRLLINKKLTYCPEEIQLNTLELDSLIAKGSVKEQRRSSSNNMLIIVKKLLEIQDTLPDDQKISYMESKISRARIQVLEDGVVQSLRPFVVINMDKIYDKLKANYIINVKKNPASKSNITAISNYNIIRYFNSVALGMLSYFRCADDFFRMKSIVNWFIRYSAISTIKHKNKLASRKMVLEKYGHDLTFTNQEGHTVSLVNSLEVRRLRKDFLINPDIDWEKKIDQIWTSFSKQEERDPAYSIKWYTTQPDKAGRIMLNIKHLNKQINEEGYY